MSSRFIEELRAEPHAKIAPDNVRMSAAEKVATAIQGGYITGIQDGNIVPRLEIDEFALDRDMTNLFLLALESLQVKDPRDPWSWFQIAGQSGF